MRTGGSIGVLLILFGSWVGLVLGGEMSDEETFNVGDTPKSRARRTDVVAGTERATAGRNECGE